jgi:glycerol-3-phosphate dehydrogenase subunit B
VERVLGLPVQGPAGEPWLRNDPFDPAGHALETAGIVTDERLRPLDPAGGSVPVTRNVRIAGSLLAGQRYLRQRCGDGVAVASGRLAGRDAATEAGGVGARSARPVTGGSPGPGPSNAAVGRLRTGASPS